MTIMSQALDLLASCADLHLPIDVEQIAAHRRYRVRCYSQSQSLLQTLGLTELAASHRALSLRLGDTVHILLSDSLDLQATSHALAHEIGHIVLGHLSSSGQSADPQQEEEAEEFALYLLAPPPLLDRCHARSVADIRARTGLSWDDSRRALRMLEDYRLRCTEARRWDRLQQRADRRIRRHEGLHRQLPALFSVAALILSALLLVYLTVSAAGASGSPVSGIELLSDISPSAYTVPNEVYWTDGARCCHLYADCRLLPDAGTLHKGFCTEEQVDICRLCYARFLSDALR